jgi:DNA-binding XRE family transcriptional regulator
MPTTWSELRQELLTPEDNKAVDDLAEHQLAEVRAHRLAEVRAHRDLTQKAVAQTMGVSQSRVSAIERGELDRSELSTLGAYVRALGGKLQIVADFGDEKLILG